MNRSRLPLVLAAALLVLGGNVLLLALASREHAGEPEATLVLTERELSLKPWGEEKGWASLALDWNAEEQWRQKAPGWFDVGKLGELGFRTRRAPSDADAGAYYGWQPAREVWLVLELREPPTETGAEGKDATSPKELKTRSRLHAVDAGLDPRELRARHPDRARSALVRAAVSAQLYAPWDPGSKTRGAPFIRGLIDEILPGEIQLPKEKRTLLDRLASTPAGKRTGPGETREPHEPRYGAVVRFSRRGMPTVEAVRALGP
jgi:hypothetical protein